MSVVSDLSQYLGRYATCCKSKQLARNMLMSRFTVERGADYLFSLLIDILNILFYALTYLRISLVSHMYILYFVMTIIIYLAGYGDGNPSPPPLLLSAATLKCLLDKRQGSTCRRAGALLRVDFWAVGEGCSFRSVILSRNFRYLEGFRCLSWYFENRIQGCFPDDKSENAVSHISMNQVEPVMCPMMLWQN